MPSRGQELSLGHTFPLQRTPGSHPVSHTHTHENQSNPGIQVAHASPACLQLHAQLGRAQGHLSAHLPWA